MNRPGLLLDGDPVELLEGLLYQKHAPSEPQLPGMVNADEIFRLTTDQYHEMIRVGIFKESDPVELVEGLLLKKMTRHTLHATSVRLCRHHLQLRPKILQLSDGTMD
jgi:hypothetical protein